MSASRTAALSRYLAALNEGALSEGKVGSVQTAPEPMAIPITIAKPITVAKAVEPTATNHSDDSARDLYTSHKVVAMPSSTLRGLSVRELAESKNRTTPATTDNNTNNDHTNDLTKQRPRSRSLGKLKSRNVVQEVYDRMGVSREDLTDHGADKFQQRYRAAAAISAISIISSRGRTTEPVQTDGNRRARSLSRGESVSSRWPPNQPVEPGRQTPTLSNDKSTESLGESFIKPNIALPMVSPLTSPARIVAIGRSIEKPAAVGNSFNRDKKEEASPWKNKNSDQGNLIQALSQGETPDDPSDEDALPSVKERMRAFHHSSPSTVRISQTKPYPIQYAKKRDHPPKIDIYSYPRRQDDQLSPISVNSNPDELVLAPEPSDIPPSPAAVAAADAAAELVRKQQEQRRAGRTPTGPMTPGKPSDFFPATVLGQQAPEKAMEISGADASGGMHADTHSVTISSVSNDDFPSSPIRLLRDASLSACRHPSRVDRNVAENFSDRVINGRKSTGTIGVMSSKVSEDMEKMVEERVQARVSDLTAKMESQIQRLEIRMEEKMKARMDMLESKIDTLGHMLTVVVTNHSKCEI